MTFTTIGGEEKKGKKGKIGEIFEHFRVILCN